MELIITEALLGPNSREIVKLDDAAQQIGEAGGAALSEMYRQVEFEEAKPPNVLTAQLGVFTVFSAMLEAFIAHETDLPVRGEFYHVWSKHRELLAREKSAHRVSAICKDADAFCEGLHRMSKSSPNARRLFEDLKGLCFALTSLFRNTGSQSEDFKATAQALRKVIYELRL